MNRVSFIFPGQGSQSIGMGRDFFENSQTAKEMFEKASDRLKLDFKKLLFEENKQINETAFTQPAILLVSSIASKLFSQNSNIKPSFALGHSLGEFSALVSTGTLEYEDAIYLVHKRGLFMQNECAEITASMMVVLGLNDELVEDICLKARRDSKLVWAANYNSDGQIVIAGLRNDLASLESEFKSKGAKRTMLLSMSVASHCPILNGAIIPLKEILKDLLKDNFNTKIISNVTAKSYNSKEEALFLLGQQLIMPVLYKQSINAFENECDIFIEFGGNVLKGLNKKITQKPTESITNMKSLEDVLRKLQ